MMKEIKKHYRFDGMTEFMLISCCPGKVPESKYVRNLIKEDDLHFIGISIESINNIRKQLFGISNNIRQTEKVLSEGKKQTEIFSSQVSALLEIKDYNGIFYKYLNGRGDCSKHGIEKYYRFDAATEAYITKNLKRFSDEKMRESRYFRELIRRKYVDNLGVNAASLCDIEKKTTSTGKEINLLTMKFNAGDFSYPEVAAFKEAADELMVIREQYQKEASLLLFDIRTNPTMFIYLSDYLKCIDIKI